MSRASGYVAIVLIVFIVSISSTVAGVSAQDLQSERHSIKVVMIPGNDQALGGNETLSGFESLLAEMSPELGLNLNLTLSGIVSEADLVNAKLLIISAPADYMIPNSTDIKNFIDEGGSIFFLSNYLGGSTGNSSSTLSNILNEIDMTGVAFENDSISISNSSANWQTRVYGDNSFAVKVNSSMFQVSQSTQSVISGLSEFVVLSCSLNITQLNNPSYVGLASAQSDTGLDKWLLLTDNGTYRAALCGSASMFNNTYLNVYNNRDLLRNIVLWLIQKFQVYPLDVSIYMVFVSSAIIVVGIVVYVAYAKRRTTTQ